MLHRQVVAASAFLLALALIVAGVGFCNLHMSGHAVASGIMALVLSYVGFICTDDAED